MEHKRLVDILYENALNEYKEKPFFFDDVWKEIVKDLKLTQDEQKEEIGNFYTDILQDARFVYVGNKRWILREYLTSTEAKSYQHKLYDFEEVGEQQNKTAKIIIDNDEKVITSDDDEDNEKQDIVSELEGTGEEE